MNASIDKVLGPLVAAGLALLGGLLTTGTFNLADGLTLASGLVGLGLVWLLGYLTRFPIKAIGAGVLPLLLVFVRWLQTGTFSAEEIQLAVQALMAFLLTYRLPRRVFPGGNDIENDPVARRAA